MYAARRCANILHDQWRLYSGRVGRAAPDGPRTLFKANNDIKVTQLESRSTGAEAAAATF